LVIIILFGILQFFEYKKGLHQIAQRLDFFLTLKLEKLKEGFTKDIDNIALPLQVGLKDIYALYPFPPVLFSVFSRFQKHLPFKTVFFIDDKGHIVMPALKGKVPIFQTIPLKDFAQTSSFLKQLEKAKLSKKMNFYIMYLPFFHRTEEKWVKKPFLALIVPVFSPYSKKYLGAGVGISDLETILEGRLKALLTFSPKVVPFVLDENRRLLYHPNKKIIYLPIKEIAKKLPPAYAKNLEKVFEKTFYKIKKQKCFKGVVQTYLCNAEFTKFYPVRIVYTTFILPDGRYWILGSYYPIFLIKKEFFSLIWKNLVLSIFIFVILVGILWFTNRFYTRAFVFISRLQQAIENLADPFVVTDMDGRCIYFNKAFEKLIGRTKRGERLCMIDPAWGMGKIPQWHKKMLRAVREGRCYELLRYKVQTLNGNFFYIRVTFSPIKDKSGKPVYVAIDFNNITQQVKLEEKLKKYNEELEEVIAKRTKTLIEREKQYREIFENKLIGIFIINPTGQFLMYNQTFKTISGYTDEDLQELNFKEMCSPSERAALEKLFQDCLEKGNVFYREVKFFRKPGNTIFVDLFLQVTQYKRETALLGFLYDVTQRKALEEKLREQDRIVILGEMAAGVAHDINNMLMVIVGNLELASHFIKDNPKQAHVYLQKAINAVQEGEIIVRRLYAYAHKKLQATEIIYNLNEILQDTVKLMQPFWKTTAEREGKEIIIKEDYGKVGPIVGNKAELREVFVNLIKNAIEAMSDGGKITIKTWQEDNRNCIMIRDTGHGIPEPIKSKVFEPFFTTKGKKGTGLGLSISLGIVRAHGGEMHVESQEGKGTTFYIYLPIVVPELISVYKEKPTSVLPSTSQAKKKILLVDDEKEILEVLSELLTTLGVEVIKASLPSKALELFQKHQDKIGIVITDLGMPEISGFELAEKLKKINPSIPIVLLTGWGATISPQERARYKIEEILTKPVTLDTLKQVLAKYDFN